MNLPRRLLVVLVVVFVSLGAAAAYLFYAPKPPLPAGGAELVTMELGGQVRRYAVVAPRSLRPSAGILLVFHRSQSSGAEMRRIAGGALERLAEKENFLVVYPDGYEGHFNDCRRVASYSARTLNVDDVEFARRIVAGLAATKAADPERVRAIGYSNGGHMALRLALEAPDLVDGIAAIAANLPAADNMDCEVRARLPRRVVLVAGNWFAGRFGTAGAEEDVIEDASGMRARSEGRIAADGWVRLVTIEGGGHTIPQAAYRFPRIFGATFRSDAVLESVWEVLTAPG